MKIKPTHYFSDNELYYYLIISKGKGKLEPRASEILYKIAVNVIRKKERYYSSQEIRNDCFQQGLLHMFENWKNFNHLKYSKAGPYFVEVFKRGMADGMNLVRNKKAYNDEVMMVRLDLYTNGQGNRNI